MAIGLRVGRGVGDGREERAVGVETHPGRFFLGIGKACWFVMQPESCSSQRSRANADCPADHHRGVIAADTADQEPAPAALTAATRKTYLVPLVKPVTFAEVFVETPSLNRIQFVPLSLL